MELLKKESTLSLLLNGKKFVYLKENRKNIAQFILAVLFVALGIWFFKHERAELTKVHAVLKSSSWLFLLFGILITGIYIILQGFMYKMAFASLRNKVPVKSTILLFLKRNFVSIFIPAGGVSSMAFFTKNIEEKGISKTKIHFASSIYVFIGIFSVILVAIPIFIYAFIDGLTGIGEWYALFSMIILIITLFFLYKSIFNKGLLYRVVIRLFPATEVFLDDLISHTIDIRFLFATILISIVIDITGIIHLYIAMLALNFHASWIIAMLGYLTAVISLSISPFMRGLGAVEVSMAYILARLGYSNIEALAITFLYRFFEFWLPLLSGALSFLLKINKLLSRIIPAILLTILGIINIISVLTPAINERMHILQDFLPLSAINASNYFVIFSGIFLLLTATFMLRGLRTAWWVGLILGIISCIGHLTKAIDYEESAIAMFVIVMLLFTKKEYYIRSNPRLLNVGFKSALLSMAAVLIYGIVGFFYLDKSHFNINFSLLQSIKYTLKNYFLIGSPELIAQGSFARNFLLSINASGFLSLSFLFYTIVKPFVLKKFAEPERLDRARILVQQFGNSSLDYFKLYCDKLIFAPDNLNAFISYKITGTYAVVLESPVAENDQQMKKCITLFDQYCFENGLKSLYYRVSEEQLSIFKELKKKSLFLGQEGIVDLNLFKLEGRAQKALRNSINKIVDKGYKSVIHQPPLKDGLIQKLKAVSDEWLKENEREEIVFSQGMFLWNEIKQQTVIVVESPEEKIVAFLNIIPDYDPKEATYDLIRKTTDAPGGVIDFLTVELFNYCKNNGFQYVNLGFAPLSGIDSPQNLSEKSMKFAYQKLKSFAHYKGLREYKEKFASSWNNKYLIYDHDFDLLQVPMVLSNVIKS